MDYKKLQNAQLDDKYVLSSRVRTGRSIKGICLPPVCTRAERRKVSGRSSSNERFAVKIMSVQCTCPRRVRTEAICSLQEKFPR